MYRQAFHVVHAARIDTLIGAALMLLGGLTVVGWLARVPALVEIRHGLVPMVFNTGLCFVLTGAAISLSHARRSFGAPARAFIAACLVTLCGITLAELVLDRSLGVDLASLHTWYDYGNTRPGRMAPNTAFGFVLIGAAIFLSDRVGRRATAVAVVALTFGVLAIGLTGLVGYLLAPDLLFGWARSARMAIHTASGMVAAALGLWLSWSRSLWYLQENHFREDGKIRMLSAAILVLVTTIAGLTGFVLAQGSLQSALENRLEAIISSRGPWFRALTERSGAQASASVGLSGLEAGVDALLKEPANGAARDHVLKAAASLLKVGYRGVMVENAQGKALAVAGAFDIAPQFTAPLDAQGKRDILWDGQIVLRTYHPVESGGQRIARIVVDEALPEVGRSLFNMARLGNTAELVACVLRDGRLLCLPSSKNPTLFSVPLRGKLETPLPMQRALAGESGIVYAVDYRGQNVLAAYGLLAPGLGFVAKQDTAEAYTPIRRALIIGTPLIVVVALLGAGLMYWQLNPLVARMRRSEVLASDAAAKMQTIMEAAGDGIITIDHEGTIQSVNEAACRIFGHERGELIGGNVVMLMPEDARAAHTRGLSGLVAGAAPRLLGTQNVHVEGLRKDGSRFPLELTINAAPLSGQRLFVGVMRDITARKELEERLSRLAQYDSLTGLPNRALFTDRLATALLRAKRSGRGLALMFLDLDGFKAINDTFGHGEGDAVLIETAGRLSSAVRKSDTVARLADDEFTVILEDLAQPDEDAKTIVAKIIEAMRTPFAVAGEARTVTASIGLVVHEAGIGGIDAKEFLRRADEAMYSAKRSGKNAAHVAMLP